MDAKPADDEKESDTHLAIRKRQQSQHGLGVGIVAKHSLPRQVVISEGGTETVEKKNSEDGQASEQVEKIDVVGRLFHRIAETESQSER